MEVRSVLPADAIPSIDAPTVGQSYFGADHDEAIVVEADAEPARADPLRILHYHEVVNDIIDDRPIAETWSPLCWSAGVYDATVDGQRLEFGVSGKLDDDLVLYDRPTGSEWKQSLGRAIAGELEGRELTVLAGAIVPYSRFVAEHPDGVVLQPPGGEREAASDDDTPARIRYDRDPYDDYRDADGYGLGAHRGTGGRDDWPLDDLEPKTVVVGLAVDDDVLGVPRPAIDAGGGVVQVSVGGRTIAVFSTPDGVHAYVVDGLTFEPTDQPGRFRADGTRWDGASGRSDDGRRLDRAPARQLFAFACHDDHGASAFYTD